MALRRLPPAPTIALGVLSIVAFGAWFYGYGVLVEPIAEETGWGDGWLGATYGGSFLLAGVLGTGVGRALDLRGSRTTFVALAVSTTVVLLAAASAATEWQFLLLGSVGGGLVGAGGYYNATSAVMARLVPEHRAHGITVLTLFGAFASPVFLPLIGWVVGDLGWRTTLRWLAVAVGLAYLLAAFLVPDVRPEQIERPRLRVALPAATRGPAERALAIAVTVAGATSALLIVQQVPAMVAAGMTLELASGFAGARGLLQLAGRLPLAPIVVRLGARSTLRWSYALMGIGALLLIGAGEGVQASAYAVVAGIGIGAMSAVESIHAADVHEGPRMGTNLGVLGLLRGVGGTIGPTVGGFVVDATGSRTVVLMLCAAGAAVSAGVLTRNAEPAAVTTEAGA